MIADCCKDLSNREMQMRKEIPTPVAGKKDVAYREICKVCKRNHYGIETTIIQIGVKGA